MDPRQFVIGTVSSQIPRNSMPPGLIRKSRGGAEGHDPWPVAKAEFPWQQDVPESMPWGDPRGTAFTATERSQWRCGKSKRRIDKLADQGPVCKHLLTEDMMAARFTCLSLDNDHAYACTGFPTAPPQQGESKDTAASATAAAGASSYRTAPPVPRRRNDNERYPMAPSVDRRTREFQHFREIEEKLEMEECELDESGSDVTGDAPLILTVSGGDLRLPPSLPSNLLYSLYPSCSELVLWQPPGFLIPEAIRSLGKKLGQNQQPVVDPETPQSQQTDLTQSLLLQYQHRPARRQQQTSDNDVEMEI